MPQLPILEHPDPRLRLPSAPVTTFDGNLAKLIDDLLETLHATRSIGISAPQVNDQRQVLITHVGGDGSEPQVYANPEILSRAKLGFVEESCLSVPGVVASIWRHTNVRVRAQDRYGELFEHDLTGMAAVCLQHEMDHLEGKLFVDRLSPIRRFFNRPAAKAQARKAKV